MSIAQFSDVHCQWSAHSSNLARGVPSFGIDPQDGSAIQPSPSQVESFHIPIEGEAWDEYRSTLRRNAEAVKGLRSFKTAVSKESEHLAKTTAKHGRDACPTSSNAPFLCLFWQQVLQASLAYGPVTEMNTSVALPDPTNPKRNVTNGRQGRRGGGGGRGGARVRSAKIDVIAQGGQRWMRMLTIKKSSLLAEFREAESHLGEVSSDSDDDGREEVSASTSSIPLSSSSSHLFAQLDDATANCSIVTAVQELVACRDASDHDGGAALTIDLTFTRIALPEPDPSGSLGLSLDYLRSAPEPERYDARLQCIANLLAQLPRVTVSNAALPCPSQKILPSSLASGSCNLPTSPADFNAADLFLPALPGTGSTATQWPPTRDVNLDVSALVALASDISHMPLPVSTDVEELQKLFRRGGLKSSDGDENDNSSGDGADNGDTSTDPSMQKHERAKYLHGRALAMQLSLEAQGKSFLGYLSDASQKYHARQPLRLHTTREAADKFAEIMRLVGGEVEQLRGRALFAGAVHGQEAFWAQSRFRVDDAVQRAFELPIRILDDETAATPDVARLSLGSATTLRSSFAPLMHATLQAGFNDIGVSVSVGGSETHSQPPPPPTTASNPRQTPHTLNSLVMGLEKGMTTLTTNMLSVRWLVREIGRRVGNVGSADDESDGSGEFAQALIVVTNPRSLAERMRVRGEGAAEDSKAVAAANGNSDNHPSLPFSSDFSSSSVAPPLPPSSSADVRQAPHSRRQDSEQCNGNVHASYPRDNNRNKGEDFLKYGDSLHLVPLPELCHRTSAGTSASSDTGGKRVGGVTAAATTPANTNATPTPWADEEGSSTYPPASALSSSDAQQQRHLTSRSPDRPRSRLRRTLAWIAGPRPAAQLTIRHYKWWPFERVERGWLRLTDAVAWREPGAVADFTDEHDGNGEGVAADRRRPRPAWLRRGLSRQIQDVEGLLPYGAKTGDADVAHHRDPQTSYRLWLSREWHTNRLHWLLLFIVYVAWLLGFAFIVKDIWSDATVRDLSPDAKPVEPTFFGCTDTYWVQNARCGIDGQDCAPFSSNTSVEFRCPAGCASTHLGAARAVGTQLPNFVPLVVGGGGGGGDGQRAMYRGDSWVCSAAVHAGIISEGAGGCGRLWQAGAYSDYLPLDANGISSIGFNSSFPSSYFFDKSIDTSKCTDERQRVYTFDVILSAFVGLVLQPKPIVWFYTLLSLGFWHINYASEPRAFPPTPGGPMGDFLPTLFVGYALWRLAFRFLFAAFRDLPIERTIWTLAAFWIGTLLNVVFADVPLQRLTGSDLAEQPGAITALVIIIVIVIVIAVNQVRVIRKTGYLPKYLTLTAVGGVIIGLLAAVPETGLRLHHYIIALILLPFTAFETRLSLIYATFLLGMFLNGVGRWGYDGIVQDIATIRGDATMGSDLPSFIGGRNWTGVDDETNTGWVYWDDLPAQGGYDGFDLIVDDVLRLSSTTSTRYNLAEVLDHYQMVDGVNGQLNNLTFYPAPSQAAINQTIVSQPHFLRLAYTSQGSPGDFTAAATAFWNGTWVDYDRDKAT